MGPSDNERAEKTQLEAMMKEHRGDMSTDAPRAQKPPKTPKRPLSNVSVQKKAPPKADSFEIMQRRRKVQSLRLRDYSYAEIGKELNIPDHIARQDMDFLRKQSADAVDQFQQNYEKGDALARRTELRIKLWEEYNAAVDEDGNPVTVLRLKILDTIRVLENDIFKLMQDGGLIVKVAEQVEHKVAYQLPWTHEVKQAVANAMLQSHLSKQLPAPEPEIIDVTEVAPPEAEAVLATKKNKDEG